MPDYEMLPEGLRGGMQRYIEHGIEPGSFLLSCLENNLVQSFGKADATNAAAMISICQFLYYEVPEPIWGSREKVRKWINLKRKEREQEPESEQARRMA